MQYRVIFFQDENKERQCRIVHRNGQEILRTFKGYKRLNKAQTGVLRMIEALKLGQYTVQVEEVPLGRPFKNEKSKNKTSRKSGARSAR